MKILFVVADAGGNLPPAAGIALQLQRRGAEVGVLGHPGLRAAVERQGLAFEAFATAPDFDPRVRHSTVGGLLTFVAMMTDRRIGDDALTVVRRDGVDLVVADTLVSGGIERLTAAGVPTVVLVHSFFAYFAGLARSPVGLLARLRGIDLDRVQASGAGRIVTARAELDPSPSEPAGLRHVGVVWQGTPVAATPGQVPRVLVSLSTSAFPGQERTLQRILDAVAQLPVEAVVTTGPALDPAAFRVPPNAAIHAWLDHDQVLPGASLVIGHGGHSTAMRALSYGVPVLVVPSHSMLDQPMVGRALSTAGVGAMLSRRSGAEQIAATVTTMLADRQLSATAAALGASIRAGDGAVAAADIIEQLAQPRLRSG